MNINTACFATSTMKAYRGKNGGNFIFGQSNSYSYTPQSTDIRAKSLNALNIDELDAKSAAARARVVNTPPVQESEQSESAAKNHWETFADKKIPSSEAPDYSTWEKEDAYCDIQRRYNLLNLLSPEKIKELGLIEESSKMNIETYNLLYDWNPFEKQMEANGGKPLGAEDFKNLDPEVRKEVLLASIPSKEVRALDSDLPQRMNRKVYCEMYGITTDEEYEQRIKQEVADMYEGQEAGAWGIDSVGAQIYQKLSEFDLTDSKNNLTGSLPGAFVLAPKQDSPYYGANALDVDIDEYYDYYGEQLLKQVEAGNMPISAYNSFKKWSDLIRDVYDLMKSTN